MINKIFQRVFMLLLALTCVFTYAHGAKEVGSNKLIPDDDILIGVDVEFHDALIKINEEVYFSDIRICPDLNSTANLRRCVPTYVTPRIVLLLAINKVTGIDEQGQAKELSNVEKIYAYKLLRQYKEQMETLRKQRSWLSLNPTAN